MSASCVRVLAIVAAVVLAWSCLGPGVAPALAASSPLPGGGGATESTSLPESGGGSLEAAATKAGNTGRAVAMSLIGLAFAVAGTVLAFRRDFRDAAGVFAVGIVAVLLATPTGLSLLRATVNSLFGAR